MNEAESLIEHMEVNLKDEGPHCDSPRKHIGICHFLFSKKLCRALERAVGKTPRGVSAQPSALSDALNGGW